MGDMSWGGAIDIALDKVEAAEKALATERARVQELEKRCEELEGVLARIKDQLTNATPSVAMLRSILATPPTTKAGPRE